MKSKFLFSVLAVAAVFFFSSSAAAKPQSATAAGTAFTYQGRLIDGGSPANGPYDLTFTLFDADVAGTQIGSPVALEDVIVTDGLFTVQLDFGSVFDGSTRYLEIGVRPGASTGVFTVLVPRQRLNPTPYALDALRAPWSGLTGIPTGFADGIDDNTTYTKGLGLLLTGTEFSVDTSAIQARVAGTCTLGAAIRAIDGTGGVTCQSIAYSHNHWGQTWSGSGTGLTLSGGSTGLYGIGTSQGVYGETTSVGGAGVFGVGPSGGGNYAGLFMANVQVYGHQAVTGTGTTLTLSGGDTGLDGAGSTSGVVGSAASIGGTGIVGNAYANSGNYAGVFNGNVLVNGNQAVTGTGTNLTLSGGSTGVDANGSVHGVLGKSDAPMGVGVSGQATNTAGTGVYGSGPSAGVYAHSNLGTGVYAEGNSYGMEAWATGADNPIGIFAGNSTGGRFGGYGGVFDPGVFVYGDFTATGTKSAAVQTQSYGPRALYAVESPENWFEDFGSGQLTNGKAVITIDPVFAQTVNLSQDYHVFLTPLGDCALYVETKSQTSFSVRPVGGQPCSAAFEYRIVAKRLGYEDLRLAAPKEPPLPPAAPSGH